MQFSLKFKHTRLFELVKKMIGLKWQISEKNKNYNFDSEMCQTVILIVLIFSNEYYII